MLNQIGKVDKNNQFIKKDIEALLHSRLINDLNAATTKYLGKINFVIFNIYKDNKVSGNISYMRIDALVMPNFPEKYYGWMLEFVTIKLKSYGATVQNLKKSPRS